MGNGALAIGPKQPRPSSTLPTLPTLAVQQDGSYLGCTGNRLTYGPARRRIGSDNGRSWKKSMGGSAADTPVLARLQRQLTGANLPRPFVAGRAAHDPYLKPAVHRS